jgi:hypothetical protein
MVTAIATERGALEDQRALTKEKKDTFDNAKAAWDERDQAQDGQTVNNDL